jgi:hypothetical protein
MRSYNQRPVHIVLAINGTGIIAVQPGAVTVERNEIRARACARRRNARFGGEFSPLLTLGIRYLALAASRQLIVVVASVLHRSMFYCLWVLLPSEGFKRFLVFEATAPSWSRL